MAGPAAPKVKGEKSGPNLKEGGRKDVLVHVRWANVGQNGRR